VPASRIQGRKLLRVLAFVTTVAVAFGIFGFVRLGSFLADEDPLRNADAIFVLAGTMVERPLEAAELYKKGYAPRVIVSRARTNQAYFRLQQLGITIATEFDLSREVLVRVGVPEEALIAPPEIHDNTADEARTLRKLVDEHNLRRIIVVSSKYHLRRAGLAIRRALRGTDAEVILRGSRYDESQPAEWWKRRKDIRWVASEVPKLLAYMMGFGG